MPRAVPDDRSIRRALQGPFPFPFPVQVPDPLPRILSIAPGPNLTAKSKPTSLLQSLPIISNATLLSSLRLFHYSYLLHYSLALVARNRFCSDCITIHQITTTLLASPLLTASCTLTSIPALDTVKEKARSTTSSAHHSVLRNLEPLSIIAIRGRWW